MTRLDVFGWALGKGSNIKFISLAMAKTSNILTEDTMGKLLKIRFYTFFP